LLLVLGPLLRAQSSAPVLVQSLPSQALALGGPAVTIDLRNYFSVPGFANGTPPAGYDTVFPVGAGTPLITLSVASSSPGVVETLLSGSTLTLTPTSSGTTTITARASDPANVSATSTFNVEVASAPPSFVTQPRPQVVTAGSTAVFTAQAVGAGTFRWERNGVAIPGATGSTLVIENAQPTDAATYTLFATSALGERASDSATLQVIASTPLVEGRLTNLSILDQAGSGSRVLTMGAVVGPFDRRGTLPIVVRAVGPTLAQTFNVPGTLGDPVMTLFAAGSDAPIDANDDWGGSETLRAAFQAVAAFALPADSRDSALVRTSPGAGVGGYTVQVTGKDGAQGAVLAEIYDATGASRTANSPRLINLSTRAEVDAGAELAVGFVIAGQTSRTVLLRGVGPSLTRLGVSAAMSDPRLELFDNNTGQRIGGNDDWSGALEVFNAAGAVGAFPLTGGTSKDAALLVTLPPGPYSARLSGVSGGGTALVEVYEVR
jgi:hypothetical protein